ncbi:MAG: DUF2971 domain-containing protein [Pseudomonadota bacterium]
MLDSITQHIFSQPPTATLYHYTSLSGLLGIVNSRELRASDIRYMNDSAELRHTLDLMINQVTHRIVSGTDNPNTLNQFLEWLSHRVVGGPMLFGASFRANGNLLSQWRGYSEQDKGVSLGFNPQRIAACAELQQFQIAKCIYDSRLQTELIAQVMDAVETLAESVDIDNPDLNWDQVFEGIEGDILRIAAVIKHPSFAEEKEWRLVSPVVSLDQDENAVRFREGTSMLVPYYAFDLSDDTTGQINLDHVFLGPTSNSELSMKSIELFLQQAGASPERGISYCQIPYRQHKA